MNGFLVSNEKTKLRANIDFLALAGATIIPTAQRSTNVVMRGSNTKPSVALMMVLPWFDKVNCIMVLKG
jgi:hypothetical protein